MTFIEDELTRLHKTHPNLRHPMVYHVRDAIAYGLILQEIEESKGNSPLIPVDKWLMAISSFDIRDLEYAVAQINMENYFRRDSVAQFENNQYSLTEIAKKEVKAVFNSDLHGYKIDSNLPGVELLGREFLRRINKNFSNSDLQHDNLAGVVALSIKYLFPNIIVTQLPPPHPDISMIQISYDDVWKSGIVVVRNAGTLSGADFFQAGFLAQNHFTFPYIMIYPSIDRNEAKLVNKSPNLYGLSALGALRFFNLLSNLCKENPTKVDKFAQHFSSIFDLRDYDNPDNPETRIQYKYEYSPGHAIRMLKKTVS